MGARRRRVGAWAESQLVACALATSRGLSVILPTTEQSLGMRGVEGANGGAGGVGGGDGKNGGTDGGGGETRPGEHVAGQGTDKQPCPSNQHLPQRPALRKVEHEL